MFTIERSDFLEVLILDRPLTDNKRSPIKACHHNGTTFDRGEIRDNASVRWDDCGQGGDSSAGYIHLHSSSQVIGVGYKYPVVTTIIGHSGVIIREVIGSGPLTTLTGLIPGGKNAVFQVPNVQTGPVHIVATDSITGNPAIISASQRVHQPRTYALYEFNEVLGIRLR